MSIIETHSCLIAHFDLALIPVFCLVSKTALHCVSNYEYYCKVARGLSLRYIKRFKIITTRAVIEGPSQNIMTDSIKYVKTTNEVKRLVVTGPTHVCVPVSHTINIVSDTIEDIYVYGPFYMYMILILRCPRVRNVYINTSGCIVCLGQHYYKPLVHGGEMVEVCNCEECRNSWNKYSFDTREHSIPDFEM